MSTRHERVAQIIADLLDYRQVELRLNSAERADLEGFVEEVPSVKRPLILDRYAGIRAAFAYIRGCSNT